MAAERGFAEIVEDEVEAVPAPAPASAPPGKRPPTAVGSDSDDDDPPPTEPYVLRVLGAIKRAADKATARK